MSLFADVSCSTREINRPCDLYQACPYTSMDESESDNATEGVIWKARDLWSAPDVRRLLLALCTLNGATE